MSIDREEDWRAEGCLVALQHWEIWEKRKNQQGNWGMSSDIGGNRESEISWNPCEERLSIRKERLAVFKSKYTEFNNLEDLKRGFSVECCRRKPSRNLYCTENGRKGTGMSIDNTFKEFCHKNEQRNLVELVGEVGSRESFFQDERNNQMFMC